MSQSAFSLVLLMIPALVGGIVAAINSNGFNDATERVEAWTRLRQQGTSASKGWFLGYIVNPVLWMIVKFCDWTDGFTHRGLKNGTRIAATLYLTLAWIFLLYIAVMLVIAIVIFGVVIYIAAKVLASMGDSSGPSYESDPPPSFSNIGQGRRGSKSYAKTGIFSEEETGRTDEDGRVFKKTGIFSEEEVGRIDEEGKVFKKTGVFSEEETGRSDKDGRVFKKTGVFSEEEVGRIDEEGKVYKKTGVFSEEETGRIEPDDQAV